MGGTICKMRAICLFALVLLPAAMAYSSASASVSASGSVSSSAYSSAPTPAAPTPAPTAGNSTAGSSSSYGSAPTPTATPTATPTTPTASPTPAPVATINVVKATLKLPGVTAAAFDANTESGKKLREAFKSTVAMGLKICGTSGTANCTSADVVITSVSRRRAEATVAFYVKTTSSAAAATGATALSNYVKTGDTFVNNLKSEAQKQGVAAAVANATKPSFTVEPKADTQSVPTPTVSGAGKTAVAAGVTVALAGLSMLW